MSLNVDNQMDQEFYNALNNSIEIFLKENNAKWNMDYHAMREYKGEEEVSKSNIKVITAELTVDYYETWANFYNFMSFSFCGLSASNKKDHYFKEIRNHVPTEITGDSDLTYSRITKLIAEFGFVDELNIKYTYKIVINFEKGQ
jgi:hypothetical protein|nr:MAG TPA: hypothetical protein [Caudoviricetes sp.]